MTSPRPPVPGSMFNHLMLTPSQIDAGFAEGITLVTAKWPDLEERFRFKVHAPGLDERELLRALYYQLHEFKLINQDWISAVELGDGQVIVSPGQFDYLPTEETIERVLHRASTCLRIRNPDRPVFALRPHERLAPVSYFYDESANGPTGCPMLELELSKWVRLFKEKEPDLIGEHLYRSTWGGGNIAVKVELTEESWRIAILFQQPQKKIEAVVEKLVGALSFWALNADGPLGRLLFVPIAQSEPLTLPEG